MPDIHDYTVYLLRARLVLGVGEETDPRRIRYAYYRRMFLHRPDRNPDTPDAHLIASLLNEACGLLLGRSPTVQLLKDKELINLALDSPLEAVPGMLTYEEWLQERFYDVSTGSIWPEG